MIAAAAAAAPPWTWILLRSTGVMAIAMLTISVVLGIMSPAWRRPSVRLAAISVHSVAAVSGVLLLLAHVALAVADAYVEVPVTAIVVPGVSVWEPLWIGLGAAALDLLVLITVTTLLRRRAPLLWRRTHLLSYVVWFLAWAHALGSGTDASSRPMLLLAVGSALAVAVAMTVRLRRPDLTRRSRGLVTPADTRPDPVAPAPLERVS